MVKGVNQTIIEINDTKNKYFTKAIFYVAPNIHGVNNKKLNEEAIKAINLISGNDIPLPIKTESKIKFLYLALGAGVSLAATIIFLLIF